MKLKISNCLKLYFLNNNFQKVKGYGKGSKKTSFSFLGFMTIFIISFSAKAQQTMTVQDAIALSLANNYDIRLSRNDSSLAALNFSFRDFAFYPRLNANGGLVYNNNDSRQVLADGSKRERDHVCIMISF